MSARHLTQPAIFLLTSLTLTMLAMGGMAYSEDQPAPPAAPAPAAGQAPAGQEGSQRAGAEAAADFYYDRGMKALEQSRLDDAIHDLTIAVDWQPGNPKYRKALEQAQGLAGVRRDTRSMHIDSTADELATKQQQLWIEAEAKIEEGNNAFERGDYVEAERNFTFAQTRLESLPYADPRKEPEERRVASLTAQAKERREKKELQEAADRNQVALDRQVELRNVSLQIENERIDAMLHRAEKARERRDYDEAILLCEQVLKINRAEDRAHSLLIKCRRERHVYLRQMTADRWDEEHKLLSESIRSARAASSVSTAPPSP